MASSSLRTPCHVVGRPLHSPRLPSFSLLLGLLFPLSIRSGRWRLGLGDLGQRDGGRVDGGLVGAAPRGVGGEAGDGLNIGAVRGIDGDVLCGLHGGRVGSVVAFPIRPGVSDANVAP